MANENNQSKELEKNKMVAYQEVLEGITSKLQNEYAEYMKNGFKELFEKIPDRKLNELYNFINVLNCPKFGYVYFLLNEDTGLIKIGCTTNLKRRMREIRSTYENYVGITPKLKLLGISFIQEDFMKKLESYFHDCYKEYRTYGEWFDIDLSSYPLIADCFESDYFIGDIVVDTREDYEYLFYKNIKKTYNFSNQDIIDYYKLDDLKQLYSKYCFENLLFYNEKSNPLYKIIKTANERDIKFRYNYLGVFYYHNNDEKMENPISLSDIKLKYFNPQDVIDAIEVLDEKNENKFVYKFTGDKFIEIK